MANKELNPPALIIFLDKEYLILDYLYLKRINSRNYIDKRNLYALYFIFLENIKRDDHMESFKEEDILEFLDKMGRDHYSPWSTVNAQKAAVTKVLSALSKEERQNISSNLDIPSLIARFETKAKSELNSDSLRTYAGRFKRAYEGFIKWSTNPSGYQPKTRKRKKANPKTIPEFFSDPNTETTTTEHQPNNDSLVKYPIVTETIRGSIEIPEKLSDADIERIIPLITQIVSSHRSEISKQDSKEL